MSSVIRTTHTKRLEGESLVTEYGDMGRNRVVIPVNDRSTNINWTQIGNRVNDSLRVQLAPRYPVLEDCLELFSLINNEFVTVKETADRDCEPPEEGKENTGGNPIDLGVFGMKIFYTEASLDFAAPAQYNGNISYQTWTTGGWGSMGYGYCYDEFDRLISATFRNEEWIESESKWDLAEDHKYSVPIITYDLRGNILTLERSGVKETCDSLSEYGGGPTTKEYGFGLIDQLDYTYNERSDRVQEIQDFVPAPYRERGFDAEKGYAVYGYDIAGNMNAEGRTGAGIQYNILNLPILVNGRQIIYDADGNKLVTADPEIGEIAHADGIEYINNDLTAIYFEEGRFVPDEQHPLEYRAEYYYRDHLGSVRAVASDLDYDGVIEVDTTHFPQNYEMLAIYNYYPFGMEMEGPWQFQQDSVWRQRYNGKDIVDEKDIRWHDYGARWYDPVIGRFGQVDPLADQFASWSTYNYAYDNPIRFIDPDGMSADDIIIGENDLETRDQMFSNLQKLTNDELTMNSKGKITIAKSNNSNTDKTLQSGTKLIRDLINDDNTTTIRRSSDNYAMAVNAKTDVQLKAQPKEGIEYDANVYVTGQDPNTVNSDLSRGVEGGAFISLGHELNHARDYVKGNFDSSILPPVLDFDKGKIHNQFSNREYKTRVFENKLRNEHNIKHRALPIPSISILMNAF